ncbi:MAG: hypothetical protein IPI76_12880 [Chloracidobacterium sp.]|nr:hypothetical protein [Chloracidobacterium sp.]
MRSMLFGLLVVVVATAFVNAQKLKPEEVAAKNLESIGTPEARAAAKTLIAVGTGTAKFLSNADLQSNGRIVIASEGTKFFLGINLESTSNRFADELYV